MPKIVFERLRVNDQRKIKAGIRVEPDVEIQCDNNFQGGFENFGPVTITFGCYTKLVENNGSIPQM